MGIQAQSFCAWRNASVPFDLAVMAKGRKQKSAKKAWSVESEELRKV